MKLLLKVGVAIVGLLALGCGTAPPNAAGQTNENAVKPVAETTPAAPAQAGTAEKPPASGFELPTAQPIEKGKTQTVGGITFTVPADWKKLEGTPTWAKFESPGKIRLVVSRMYDVETMDMLNRFSAMRLEDPKRKIMMRAIDGELGILDLEENSRYQSGDVLSWQTFPPPDAKGYAVRRAVSLTCPPGTYEQHKQIMFDILFATKLQK